MAKVIKMRQHLEGKVSQLSIKSNNRKQTVSETQNIIQQLVEQMKRVDPLFNQIYKQIIYTGSYYEKLKIHDADEFDLNLQLELPFQSHKFGRRNRSIPKGFYKYQLEKDLHKYNVNSEGYDQIFQEDFKNLSRTKINSWMQSVVTRALDQRPIPQIIRISNGSPATTLKIELNSGKIISVDLVPVIQLDHIPKSTIRKTVQGSSCCLVPKPPPSDIKQKNDDSLFRVSFPEFEKNQLRAPKNLKPLIRLFKSIRDDAGLEKAFPSYLIKTFFMWQIDSPKTILTYWSNTPIESIFKRKCELLIKALKKKSIRNYYFPSFNLLDSIEISDDVINLMISRFAAARADPIGFV
ncbi:hypothetical protein CHUAL_000112 [Chamberlinius hualienensis]